MDETVELQARLQFLIDNEIPTGIAPELRLCLAVLRQAVIDYFEGDPMDRYSAWEYFARSPLYAQTLQCFGLPPDLLPAGVDVGGGYRRNDVSTTEETESLGLEKLVRELSGAQLKVVLAMGGMLPLPNSAGAIARACDLNRTTAAVALEQLSKLGLVEMEMDGTTKTWALPAEVRKLLQEVWGRKPAS